MKLTGQRNQCPACAEYFKSNAAFDKHRTGKYGARRCMTTDEMRAAGMVQRAGWWVGSAMPANVLDARAHDFSGAR